MSEQVSRRIKFLGLVMTCIMVLYHCGSAEGAADAADAARVAALAAAFDLAARFAMAYFFTVTGFLLFHGLDFSTYKRKIKSRLSSLLVPYLAWQLVFTLPGLLRGHAPAAGAWFDTVFLLQRWPPDGALWYVYAVFLLAVLSPPLILLFRRRRAAQIGIAALILALYLLGGSGLPAVTALRGYGCLDNIWRYLPAYLVGAYCGAFGLEDPRTLWPLVPIAAGAAVLTVWQPGVLGEAALCLLPTLLLCLLPAGRIRGTARVYRLTFLLYALHEPLIPFVLRPLRQGIQRFAPCAAADLGGRVLYLGFVTALAAALYAVLQKTCPRLLRVLTGGRG